MAYKMKGPSMYKDKLTVNRNGYDNKPDGKSKSSAFQKEVHSMFYQNKPGAPDMKTGKYEHSFEKGGAPDMKTGKYKHSFEKSGAPKDKKTDKRSDAEKNIQKKLDSRSSTYDYKP